MSQQLIAYFFADYHSKVRVLWFKRLLYLFLIVHSIYWLCYYDVLFGSHAIAYTQPQSIGYFRNLAFLLYNSGSPFSGYYFISALLVLSILNLFRIPLQFFSDLIIWFIVVNIHNKIYPALTGGSNLLNQFLFFNCFLSSSFPQGINAWKQLKTAAHNFAIIAVLIQVCLVYFLSGLAKTADEKWLNGEALNYITQIRHFSMFSFSTHSGVFEPGFKVITYLVLCYQLLFPLLVWIRSIKRPLLIFGILMHLYIAFVMGLVAFGFIMVLAYVFFWPVKQADS